jgi:hypothetical protein
MTKSLTQKQIIDGTNYMFPLAWAIHNGLKLIGGQKFNLADHPYQQIVLERTRQKVCRKWAAQTSKTTGTMVYELHHLVYGYYPQGSMFIFPTTGLVERFSKSRFTPMIEDNTFLQSHIRATDTIELKRVGKSNLYFVGGKVLQKIGGEQKTSAALKSEPVDSLNFDEVDEIDQNIILLALDRIGHSMVKNESYTGTPSIPDYGIDKMWQESDQNLWQIKCRHCNIETCIETEFPDCIKQEGGGRWYRACKKCGREIFPIDGRWVPQYPGREIEGTWISRLNLADKYVNLGDVVKRYMDPPLGDMGKVMNGDLGMAYISAENRLTASDMLAILGRDPMMAGHPGPTAMGVDVGNDFHVVIVDRPNDRSVRLVKAVHLSSRKMTDFNVLHDLIVQYHVKTCVIDFAPAQAKVRSFRNAEKAAGCEVFGNIYQDEMRGVVNWNDKDGVVRENRTEICDNVHDLVITPGALLLPRNSEVMGEVIKHFCNLAKVLEEDRESGSKEYRYRKLGPDHYRHAAQYALLASKRIGVYTPKAVLDKQRSGWDAEEKLPKSKNWLGA